MRRDEGDLRRELQGYVSTRNLHIDPIQYEVLVPFFAAREADLREKICSDIKRTINASCELTRTPDGEGYVVRTADLWAAINHVQRPPKPCTCPRPITSDDVTEAWMDLELREGPKPGKYALWDMIGQYGCHCCLNASMRAVGLDPGKSYVTGDDASEPQPQTIGE